ncbi:1755_t:CDS:2 [Scutellospora calospora]|uniref:1755_t:CDS:1 n=1 Tax=Scutellospora calospora TaxID=85575 RepID=A0ACA9KET6_9GLOM|nr:1755_t:CDS:2 [Scutellospora calospora]
MLSGKITGITLKIDQFGNHLNSYGEVCDYELELFRFTTSKETGMQDLKVDDLLVPCDAAAFLDKSNSFLPPVTKEKDRHYLNAIYMFQYFNNLKIPAYDTHLSSLSAEDHSR